VWPATAAEQAPVARRIRWHRLLSPSSVFFSTFLKCGPLAAVKVLEGNHISGRWIKNRSVSLLDPPGQ
jgi:hypothetical protein